MGVKKREKARRHKAMKQMKMKKVVGFIPARGGSKGITLKNIRVMAGYPMLAHSILTMKVAGLKDIWVSTDHPKIKRTAEIYGARVIERPEKISGDDASTEKAIDHFIRNVACDVVVMVQCTSPMLRPLELRNGLHKFLSTEGIDSMFSAVVTNDMLLWDKSMMPINYNPKKRGFRQDRRNFVLWESGGFYIFTKEIFEKTYCRLGGNISWSEVKFWKSFQVDSQEDLEMIDKLMEKKNA